jgi:hypothetical protein
MTPQERPIGASALAVTLSAASLVGIVACIVALPRTSNTSPLLALLALVWSSLCIGTAALTWRRSRLAGPAFVPTVGMLLLPAKLISPGSDFFLPAFVVIAPVALLGYRYLRKVSRPAAPE